ncbi:MAG: N-acetylmuramoyl-L-alanine amidase [Gaiellales bacterium]|nr:N-acetylmuramoyl-L-alanine amidase [Gaiellales bacterium]
MTQRRPLEAATARPRRARASAWLAACSLVILSAASGAQAQPATQAARNSPTASYGLGAANTHLLSGTVIVIDPGHNPGNAGHPVQINRLVQFGAGMKPCDTTGTATIDGYTEAAYTLDVAYRVRALLGAAGAHVILTHTRTSPAWGPCITERAAIGNRYHAAAAVSIHADGGPANGRGFSTIIPATPLPAIGLTGTMITHDRSLAIAIRDEYQSATAMPYSTYLGNRGIYASNAYGGTNLSRVPKIFIETGNMRNQTDAALLESPAFRQRAARGIASGIVRFVANR